MKREKLFEELKTKAKNLRFARMCKIAELFGFRFRGGKGSHRIYVRKDVVEMLNFQDVNGKAKPYQVQQFIKVIEKYHLIKEEKEDV